VSSTVYWIHWLYKLNAILKYMSREDGGRFMWMAASS